MFWDIAIIVIAMGIVAAVVVRGIVNAKKGKTACGCDCASCVSCSACKKPEKDKNE